MYKIEEFRSQKPEISLFFFIPCYLAPETELKSNCQDLLELDFTEQLELLPEEVSTETL
jgi:hypothetical protein